MTRTKKTQPKPEVEKSKSKLKPRQGITKNASAIKDVNTSKVAPESESIFASMDASQSSPLEKLTDGLRSRPMIQGVQKHWVWVLIGISVAVIALLLGLYIKSQHELSKVSRLVVEQQKDPIAQVKVETMSLLEAVGKLIDLPKDEEPTIATVSDLTKLQGQAFFEKAQLGDKVIIYTKAKKAILYRPQENKIIELAPLNTGSEPMVNK